jgi:hypothetical protein
MLMNKTFALLTGIALLSSSVVASAAEQTKPVKLTAMQMDKVIAGSFNVAGIVFDFGDLVKINNQVAVVTVLNLGSVLAGVGNGTVSVIQASSQ